MRGFCLGLLFCLLAGCASRNTYGVPYDVWTSLTKEQQQQLANYDKNPEKVDTGYIWREKAKPKS